MLVAPAAKPVTLNGDMWLNVGGTAHDVVEGVEYSSGPAAVCAIESLLDDIDGTPEKSGYALVTEAKKMATRGRIDIIVRLMVISMCTVEVDQSDASLLNQDPDLA